MKRTSNLIELMKNYLEAKNVVVIENIVNKEHGYIKDEEKVLFNFPSMRVEYEACNNLANTEEIDFLYNVLSLHLKSLEIAMKDENCLSTVSNHELKNILSSAKLSLEMLSTYDFDKDDRARLLLQAFNAVTQSVSLFDEMVLMDKLQHQKSSKSIKTEMVNVLPIIDSILVTLSADISTKGLHVQVNDKSGDIAIRANAFWIERALFNLISNAVKYNKSDGSLTIDVISEKKNLLIKVSDSGIGIKESEQDKVLEMFQTSEATQDQGTGVGLALVKAISDVHNGILELESEHGEGTTFSLRLPKKMRSNRIAHPMAVMNAAALLLLVGVSYFFPVIPSFGDIETAQNYETIKLDNGSSIKIKKGAKYSFLNLHNLDNTKTYRRLNLDSGQAEADLHNVHVAFVTPTASFTNLGTELNFEQKRGKGVVSVYKGELEAEDQHVYEGQGFSSTKAGISVVDLLDPPYGLSVDNSENGDMIVHYDAVKGAKKYRLTLAKDDSFNNIIDIKESAGLEVHFHVEKDGYYYLKIAAEDENGILGMPNTAVLTNSYHLLQGIKAQKNGAYTKAQSLFEQSINEFEKHNQQPYSKLAWNYYLQQEYPSAVRSFKQAITINPTEGDKVRLARTFYHLKEYEKASKIYKELLVENPNDLDALWGEAEVLIVQRSYNKARKMLTRLLKRDYKYPLGNYAMARIQFLTKNKKAGLRYLDKELKYHPDSKMLVKEMQREVRKGAH